MNGQDTLRENLEHALVDLNFGYWGQGRERVKAALAILDNAEADMFEESVGMVALIPDGTAWYLTAQGWTRKSDPVGVVSPRPNQPQETP